MHARITLVGIYVLCFTAIPGFSQKSQPEWRNRLQNVTFEPILAVQLWSSYSFGHQVYRSETGAYETVDDRFNVQIRRTRLGFRAKTSENFNVYFIGAIDLVGRDVLSSQHGGANNGSVPEIGLWDAGFQWRLKPGSEALYLSGGYFRPPFSRESLTSGMRVSSMEKSWSQRYIRSQVTGANPGRAMGLMLGGLLRRDDQAQAFSYEAGIFNPVFEAYQGNSSGKRYAPLLAARASLHVGAPEFKRYTRNFKLNYFGARNGLTVSLQGIAQGETALFRNNYAAAADLLLNYGPLNLDAEWALLWRGGQIQQPNAPAENFTATGQTGHVRASYNIRAGKKYVLEPVLMYMHFSGPTDIPAQEQARMVGMAAGRETTLDAGINWYFDPDLKLMLHYTHHAGDSGDAGPGATVNDYFYQKETGAIRRGDWLGLGLVAVF